MKHLKTFLLALTLVSTPVLAGYSLKIKDANLVFTDAPCPTRIAQMAVEQGAPEDVAAKLKVGIAQPDDKKVKSITFCYVTIRKGTLAIITESGGIFTMDEPLQI